MTGKKRRIRVTGLVLIVSSLLILAGFTRMQVEIPIVAQSGDPPPPGPVVLTDGRGEYPLGLHMGILEDPGGELTIEEVSSPAFEARFTASQAQNPVYGFTDSAYWVRVELDNETSRTTNWVLTINFANFHYVDLYTPLPSGGFSVEQSGTLRPMSARDYLFSRIAFGLMVPTQTQQTYYLRFRNGASMTIGATLWTMKDFMRESTRELLLYGALFGALAALLAYHIFLLLIIREETYLYFVMLLACLLVTLLVYRGYMQAYVLPNVYDMTLYVFPVTNGGYYFAMVLFTSAFLELKTRHPWLYRVNMGVVVVWGALILLTFFTTFGNFARWQTTWDVVTVVVILVSGLVSWWKGYHPATIFLISWLALAMSFLLLELVRKGYLPSSYIAENSFEPAILIMAVGWSMALADRINEWKANTQKANQELQNSQRELAQILDGVPLGIVVYGKDQFPRYVNQRAREILSNAEKGIEPGLRPRRTLAQAIDYFSLRVAGTNVKYPLDRFPIYRALKGEPASVDDLEADLVDRRIPIEVWASPVKDKVGNVESAVAAFQDTTQRKQAEAELATYRKHLEELVEERTTELNLKNQELGQRVEWLAAINQVNQILAGSADFAQIYEKIVEIINGLFAARDSFIAEWEGQEQQLKILAHSCRSDIHPDLIGSLITLPESMRSLLGLEQGSLVVFALDQIDSLDGPLGLHLQIARPQSMALVPLRLREHHLGFLGLELEDAGRTFTKEEANLLSILSTDIAQLIEDAHLFEQAKLLIAAEERHRLARGLHDSVVQALYSINLFTDAAQMALENDRIEVVKTNLYELIALTREAMVDMRLLIFQLRPPDLEEVGLVPALKSRLDAVEAKAGIQVVFRSEGELTLSPQEEDELYWIAQEVLNNVIKHAHASRVEVQLTGEAGCIRLEIADNGVGLDTDPAGQSGGQGIRDIYERAEKIGARCWIESTPGQGTTVTIEVNK